MTAVVIAMLLCVAAGLVVVGYVAVEARRDGREIWTPEGEEMIAQARRQGEQLVERGERLGRRTASSVRRTREGSAEQEDDGSGPDQQDGGDRRVAS